MRKLISLLLLAMMIAPAQAQFSKPRKQYVEYLAKTNNPTRLYHLGEQAMLTIEAYKGGNPLNGVKVYYRVGDEMMLPAKEDSVEFVNGIATIQMGTMQKPGFRACNYRFTVYDKTYKDLLKVGYEPFRIETCTPMPEDFEKFWQKTMKETNKIDLAPEITPLPKYSTDKVEVSLVKLTVGKNGRNMYGYLPKPKDGKKHPVLFCPPGAGSSKIQPTT